MATTKLEAGTELDVLVAEAMGISLATIEFPGVQVIPSPAPYSTDLNAAFVAATIVGLFAEDYVFGENPNGDGWAVSQLECQQYCAGAWLEPFAIGPTPALAICRGILKLKGQGDD